MGKIKIAAGGKNVMNFSVPHTSTFEVGQVRPTFYRHMLPSEKISVDMTMKANTAPILKPSFAKLDFVHRGFFVPYSQISPRFEDFYNHRTINNAGIQSEVSIPSFSLESLCYLFISSPSAMFIDPDDSEFNKFGQGIAYNYSLFHADNSSIPYRLSNSVYWSQEVPADKFKVAENMFIRAVRSSQSANLTEVKNDIPTDFPFDFCYFLVIGTDDNPQYICVFCQLKPFGRFVLKCLDSLGYRINFPFQDPAGYSGSPVTPNQPRLASQYMENYNGLALLGFLKVIFDNYLPSQYANVSVFAKLFTFINQPFFYCDLQGDLTSPGINPQYYDMTDTSRFPLQEILINCMLYAWQVYAGSNYFTDAWYKMDAIIDSAVDEYNNQSNMLGINNDASRGTAAIVNATHEGTFFGGANSDPSAAKLTNASATGHKFMNSLYNLFKRSSLAGTKLGDAILAIFGVNVPSAKSFKSVYLGKKVNELMIYDVTQSATTDQGQLGEFAGKGLTALSDGNGWSYEADDFGIFFVLSSMISQGGYVQGIDRMNLLLDSLEFYHPELEKIGNLPIMVEELMAPPTLRRPNTSDTIPANTLNYENRAVFGYAPNYSFMKYPKPLLTGDFNVPHNGGGIDGKLQAYHSYRLLQNPNFRPVTGTLRVYDGMAQSNVSMLAQKEILFDNGMQYNRIFNVIDNEQDHVFADMYFKVKLITPMIPMENAIDLDGFREVSAEINGESMD